MRTSDQRQDYSRFMSSVFESEIKIQIGARGAKHGPDWLAVDLYDISDVIDRNWDLHCLPIADNSVDCYVCNAVLEHVTDPVLAVYEMQRTLKIGGQIWVEVPFLQYFHPSPGDYTRWTVDGLKLLFRDFEVTSAGVSVMIGHEVRKITGYLSRAAKQRIPEKTVTEIEAFIENYQTTASDMPPSPRLYSSAYIWAEKTAACAPEKHTYFQWLRQRYNEENDLPYRPETVWAGADLRPVDTAKTSAP